ncbi:alpha/beta hydrolase [Sphingomonas aracearum]|uniref:Alpha/beta hydrolase n=1 Tax=Sphingomonas aracearum TaxID=2283317 RepID=A0A369W569_9SPHN|nr:alpha/beta hydrolase [Sphingomonas aracearum]RDE07221.1 alpha/beta hydrolase [Sphingomonas aracearum]
MLNASSVRPLDGAPLAAGAVTFDAAVADPALAVVTAVAQPLLLEFAPEQPNGRAMLVLGGGGYVQLMAGREGVQVARWLNALGYHAWVLIHRFPDAANGPAAPLADALAAMRLLREAHGSVGVVGLSSGGHLAACLAAETPAEWGLVSDAATRPDVLVIGYAPISTNAAGRTIVADKPPLPPAEKQAMYDRLQPDAQLLAGPPPAFLVYSGNDPVVPVENARRLHAAWERQGGAAELHVFADAPHGFALDTPGLPVSLWPDLCAAWLRQAGFL